MSLAAVPWLLLVLSLLGGGLGAWIAKKRKEDILRLKGDVEEAERRERLAVADNEALLKYMADKQELEDIHEDDYVRFKVADNKHTVVSFILDRLYNHD